MNTKAPRSLHTWILGFVIVFPLVSIGLVLAFVSISSQFSVPDFVYIDYQMSGVTEEILQVQDGTLVLQPSPDYQACLNDIQNGGDSWCQRNYQPFSTGATIYRYSNGESIPVEYEEIQDVSVTSALTHPTQNTTFGSTRCDGPEFYPIETGGYSQNTCYLSIRKGSWQTRNVSVYTYPNLSNDGLRYGSPQNIFWIID